MKQFLSMAHTPLLKALLWSLLVFLQFHQHAACFHEERIALLELKAFLKSNIINAHYPLLLSWIDDAKSNCCGWERVTCNSTTAHVIKLSLDNLNQSPFLPDNTTDMYGDSVHEDEKNWSLNVSLLVPFKELTSLNLSDNAISGCLPNQGFERLALLPKLEILNLGSNSFDYSIIPSLSRLASLKKLSLAKNNLETWKTIAGFESFSRLANLKTLDLSKNSLNRSIIESLPALKSLKNLNLAWNFIEGSFPIKELSAFENLEILDLSFNELNGSPTIQGFENLSRLETLDLRENNFDKSIIESLSAVKSLKNLNLAWNHIEGSFPAKELSAFENLERLDLSENNFDGPLTIQGLSNFSRLEILDLSGNSLTGSISPCIGTLSSLKAISLVKNQLNGTLPEELCALKKLEELELYDNLLEGILPTCLNNMTSLRLLDISSNRFVGNISSYLIASPTSLEYIDLRYNQFEDLFQFNIFANHSKLKVILLGSEGNKLEIETEKSAGWGLSFQLKVLVLSNCNLNKLTGNIPKFLFDQRELKIIDLSHNKLKGSFPIWLLENNKELRVLNLSRNQFEGYLPSSIGEMSKLENLDLSFNYFSGELPMELVANCTSLEALNLGNNRFNGELFSNHFNLESLRTLKLNDNQFTGTLSVVSLQGTILRSFDISNNSMSGTITEWIGNMTNLRTLIVSKNSFRGRLPCELGSFEFVDLSHNSLSGSLPSCLNLQHVEHLLLQGNKLTGPIPKAVFNSSSLLTLDLRGNNFFGKIPNEIGALSNLRILLLKGNNFRGIIPNQLCWLKKIGIMDLSMNSLSGTIPNCFHNMSFGKILITDYPVYDEHVFVERFIPLASTFQRLLESESESYYMDIEHSQQVEVDLITKYRSSSYRGGILNYMSGLDLSCNKLKGRIPQELGKLSSIHALNLSYNHLTGSIPQTFSNLSQLESLDLSHNNLSEEIPSTLIDLNFIEVFNVAYNNLSGKVPDLKAQFGTFGSSSYEGNPFLCGQPLESCTREDESHPSPTKSSNASEGKWYEVDHQVFSASFIASYIIFFLTVSCLLYIHPYWQQRCFNLIEDLKYQCYYPVFDTFKRMSNRLER